MGPGLSHPERGSSNWTPANIRLYHWGLHGPTELGAYWSCLPSQSPYLDSFIHLTFTECLLCARQTRPQGTHGRDSPTPPES